VYIGPSAVHPYSGLPIFAVSSEYGRTPEGPDLCYSVVINVEKQEV